MEFPDIIVNFIGNNTTLFVKIVSIIVVLIVSFIITMLIRGSLKKFGSDFVQKHFKKAVYRISQIIIAIIAIFIILGIWGVNLSGLLAGAGFMGIVVGLAAQETIGNVISGILMMFSRPFEIGDWVEISGYSGIVEDITIVNTRMKTFDGEIVSIPNRNVSSTEINNKSRMEQLRVKKTIGIDYDSDPIEAKKIAERELKNHESIIDDPAPKALVDELGDSSVNIILLFWIDDPAPKKRRKVVDEIITSIKSKYEEVGIGIPFPHRELIQHEEQSWKLKDE